MKNYVIPRFHVAPIPNIPFGSKGHDTRHYPEPSLNPQSLISNGVDSKYSMQGMKNYPLPLLSYEFDSINAHGKGMKSSLFMRHRFLRIRSVSPFVASILKVTIKE